MFIRANMLAAGSEKSIEDLSYVTFFYQNNGQEYLGWFDEGYSEGDYKADAGKVLGYQTAVTLDFSIATFNITKVGSIGTITYKTDCMLLKNGEKTFKSKGTIDDMASMFNAAYKFKIFGIRE